MSVSCDFWDGQGNALWVVNIVRLSSTLSKFLGLGGLRGPKPRVPSEDTLRINIDYVPLLIILVNLRSACVGIHDCCSGKGSKSSEV